MKSAVTAALECAYDYGVGDPVSVEYVRRLYMTEMLKNMDISNVDLQVARQFGCEYHEPWAENRTLVKQFLHSHKKELRQYLCVKVGRVVDDLVNGLMTLDPSKFYKTPIDKAAANTICRALDNLLNESEFVKNLNLTYTIGPGLSGLDNTTLRISRNDYGDFMIAEQLLKSVVESRNADNRDDTKVAQRFDYGASRGPSAIDNDYITKCFKCVMKHHHICLKELRRSAIGYNPNAWGHLLGLLYRLFYPRYLMPGNLHQMFGQVVCCSARQQTQLITEARRFSAASIESVIDSGLPCLDHHFVVEEGYQKDQRHNIDPNSLCEDFLVLSMILDSWERRNRAKYE